ncbi:MAG: UPF0182 family protein [Trueperella sp.]|nr:UPF0182 family protein [Trueperella sp.]
MTTSTPAPEKPQQPGAAKPKMGGAFIPTLAVLAALLLAIVIFAGFYTELQWFKQVEAARVFWTQYGATIGIGLIGVVLTAVVVAVSLRIALGAKPAGNVVRLETPAEQYRSFIYERRWLTYGVVPLVTGLLFGSSLGGNWRSFLLLINGSSFGVKDPEYGLDVSFFVFLLPVLHVILSFLLMLLVLSALFSAIGYWVTEGISAHGGKFRVAKKVKRHAAILLAIGALLMAVQYWLRRYDLLLGNNQRFSGASYTDINASKPGLTILAIAVALVALLFIYAAIRQQFKPALVGIAASVATALLVSFIYPALVQNFKVKPNAAELESTFIQRNIDATLAAYGLEDVEIQSYQARTDVEPGQLRKDSETAAQIRLLDPNIVDPSFNQLQQNRQYYQFKKPLTVDRYTIDDQLRDTVIAVRELNLDGLDNERRSWVNDHTVYTHGFGVAAAYGNTMNTRGDPAFWEAGIPSVGELGDYEPRVYFGQQSPEYSIVGAPEGSEEWELDYPDDEAPNGQVNTTYKGDGGPAIANAFEKLMYAVKFRSTDIFFSDRVTNESQILFDRDPHERVRKVAPYLTLDAKAVPAVVDMDGNPDTRKDLVWIIDAYTTSNNYPYSARETLEDATADSLTRGMMQAPEEVNYIRNSVKAVVNAYDGSVTLYQWDDEDPILQAWSQIFSGQITPLSEMPGDLIAHVRYPEDLFKVQRQLLARYHVTDAKSFYYGGDFWRVPLEPTQEASPTTPKQPPYYLTLKMPGQDEASFSLTTSYIPGGNTNRNVMTGFLAADGNAGNEKGKIADTYGKLRLLELPRDLTVPGPGQAENTMLTNPKVSTDLNLLRQGGTQTLEGNLLSLPIGDGLLYVQPIYVQASKGTQYPTLQYVLTLFGDKVGFAPTLDESLDQVFGGDSGVSAGDVNVAGDKEAPITGGKAPGATAAPSAPQGDNTPPAATGPAAARLDAALQAAKKAIQDSDAAMKNGDWAAYGKAQDALNKAIEQAVTAQQELDAKK